MSNLPEQVTIVMPCRNEEDFIAACLESVVANDYPKEYLELLIVEGRSVDKTRSIIEDYAKSYQWMKVLDNPKGIAPTALNLGIARARGNIIMRMDAHAIYPCDYISRLVAWLRESGADNTGGMWNTLPASESPLAKAIATGLSHPFGVGNSYYRVGTSKPRWVDTVPFGCYRREVFDRIGLFDEELVRNQDDEFNHRLLKHGGRILLVPDVVAHYYARASLTKLALMNYQYGYFKPLVARKIGAVMTMRQLVPALFVLSLLGTGLLSPWSWTMYMLFVTIVLSYVLTVALCSVAMVFKRGLGYGLALPLVFPSIHFSYGIGFVKGVLDFVIFRRTGKRETAAVPLSR